jgi:hypothetical protein
MNRRQAIRFLKHGIPDGHSRPATFMATRWAAMTDDARQRGGVDTVPPEQGFLYWMDYIRDRVERHYDAVIADTGEEGTGKSTLALRVAQAMDPDYDPAAICYTARDVLAAYRTAKAGQPILYDEGARGLLAGETFTPEQVGLVRALMLAREKSAVLILCIPSIWALAKQVRGRRATLWFHVVSRGLARVHVRDTTLKYKPTQTLGLFISSEAPHLTWNSYPQGSRFWAAYLRRKNASLEEYLTETDAMLERARVRELGKQAKENALPPRGTPERWRIEKKRWREKQRAKLAAPPSLAVAAADDRIK